MDQNEERRYQYNNEENDKYERSSHKQNYSRRGYNDRVEDDRRDYDDRIEDERRGYNNRIDVDRRAPK